MKSQIAIKQAELEIIAHKPLQPLHLDQEPASKKPAKKKKKAKKKVKVQPKQKNNFIVADEDQNVLDMLASVSGSFIHSKIDNHR